MHGRVTPGVLALGVICLMLLSMDGCSTPPKKPALVAKPAPKPVTAKVTSEQVEALDLDTVSFAFGITVNNPTDDPVRIVQVLSHLAIGGAVAATSSVKTPVVVDPGESAQTRVVFAVGLRQLSGVRSDLSDGKSLKWDFRPILSIAADTKAGDASYPKKISAFATGTIPTVSPPTVRIQSLKIERYDLIESKLKLILAVENPNSFPVSFTSINYTFSAEGRTWGDGTVPTLAKIPADGRNEVDIPLTLNFIDMGRKVLDKVASLGVVHYQMEGTSIVATKLAFLPEFSMEFRQNGSIKVEK